MWPHKSIPFLVSQSQGSCHHTCYDLVCQSQGDYYLVYEMSNLLRMSQSKGKISAGIIELESIVKFHVQSQLSLTKDISLFKSSQHKVNGWMITVMSKSIMFVSRYQVYSKSTIISQLNCYQIKSSQINGELLGPFHVPSHLTIISQCKVNTTVPKCHIACDIKTILIESRSR